MADLQQTSGTAVEDPFAAAAAAAHVEAPAVQAVPIMQAAEAEAEAEPVAVAQAVPEVQVAAAAVIAAPEPAVVVAAATPAQPAPQPASESQEPELSKIMVMGEEIVDPVSRANARNSFLDQLSERQLAELKQAFDRFDTDRSGSIDAVELASTLKELGQVVTQGELLDMLQQVDEDGNGTIEFDEFCRMMVQRGPSAGVTRGDAIEAFRVFDSEGNGRISMASLRKALMSLGERFSDWEFEKWLEQTGLTMGDELQYEPYVQNLFGSDF